MARTGRDFFSKKTWSQLSPLIGLQLLWLISFQFLGLHTVYSLMVLAFALIMFFWIRHRLSEQQKIELQLQATVITMFTLSLGLSPLYLESGTVLRFALLAFSLPAAFTLGYLVINIFKLDREKLFYWMMHGFSLYVLVNIVLTIFYYAPFYRFLYVGQVIYVNGEVYSVIQEVKWLIGLRVVEIDVMYMNFYLTLLWMPAVAHILKRFMRQPLKQNHWWMLPTIVASLGVLLLPTWLPLILALLFGLLGWVILLWPRWSQRYPKFTSRLLKTGFSFIAIMVGLFLIDTVNLFGIASWIKQFRPFSIVLDYRTIEAYQSVLRTFPTYLFGGFAPIIVQGQYLVSTQSLVFDALHQGGIFAFTGLVLMGYFFIRHVIGFGKQVKRSSEMALILVLVAFMFWQTFMTQLYPYIREENVWTSRLIFDEPLWLLLMFFMGTMVIIPTKTVANVPKPIQETRPHIKTPQSTSRRRRVVKDQ